MRGTGLYLASLDGTRCAVSAHAGNDPWRKPRRTRNAERACYTHPMPARTFAIHDDIIDAVREDDIENVIAEARERQKARDGYDWSQLP